MMSLNKELECKVAHSVDDDDDTDEMDPFPLFLSLSRALSLVLFWIVHSLVVYV